MYTDSSILKVINQLHTVEQKLKSNEALDSVSRNFNRISNAFEEMNIIIQNPIGETYDETRFDCEASISGESSENLQIIEVIKPIVYKKDASGNALLQRGIVIAESKQ